MSPLSCVQHCKLQCPHATKVAGYRTWQTEFDRHVKEGEKAIWIWAPIIARQCPDCENSPSYHERSGCEYGDTDPDEWDKGLVGFRPAPVFDVSQTEGEPLPELETEANGNADELDEFYVAEDYHQKFQLRDKRWITDAFEEANYDAEAVRESPAAAKLNAHAAGFEVDVPII